MSHPIPGHNYGEQTRGESNKAYAHRRAGSKPKLNATQKMTGSWLKEAGKLLPKKGENHLSHIKRLIKGKSKTKALSKKKGRYMSESELSKQVENDIKHGRRAGWDRPTSDSDQMN